MTGVSKAGEARRDRELAKKEAERRERLQAKKAWFEQLLNAMDPPWPFDHQFKYSEHYDLWRADYKGKVRQMIRDFQTLKTDLRLDGQYEINIEESHYICVRRPLGRDINGSEMLLADIPMDEPLEPEDIIKFNYSLKSPVIIGFLSTKLKSHLHRFYQNSRNTPSIARSVWVEM